MRESVLEALIDYYHPGEVYEHFQSGGLGVLAATVLLEICN